MKNSWQVDMNRLVELVAERMYSEPIKAGIRELITNSLDARKGQVEISINYFDDSKRLEYSDTGIGIDPESFEEIYGKIASGHKRRKGSRGFFGLGRMSLIAASKRGQILSFRNGKFYKWSFTRAGWEGPNISEDLDQIGHGIYLEFEGIEIENLAEIEDWIRRTFAIPLYKKECRILLNNGEIKTPLEDYKESSSLKTKHGLIQFYIKEKTDGTLFICQKGIMVREEPYTGLSAYIDQSFLDIKTDREGFVNNRKYRTFRSLIKKELAHLRPVKSFEKMEVDFIKRLMKEFKKYWFKRGRKESHIMEKLEIEFPSEGHEIIEEESPEEGSEIEESSPTSPHDYYNEEIPQVDEEEKEIKEETDDLEMDKKIIEENQEPLSREPEVSGFEPQISSVEEKRNNLTMTETKEETKVVRIKGAKPVDMGEDYPVIFFERDPFVLIFNTSHPVFRELIEKGELGSHELAVLFERMFECAYTDQNPMEDIEHLKERWKEVDQKLKELFKRS